MRSSRIRSSSHNLDDSVRTSQRGRERHHDRAKDSPQHVVTQSVTIARQQAAAPPSDPPPPPSPGAPDTTPPSLTIVSPASNTFSMSASSIVVSGTASDNVGVAKVAWRASSDASGTATGTTNWSTPAIPLYLGATTIVVTASDAAGNTSWRSVVVTANRCLPLQRASE